MGLIDDKIYVYLDDDKIYAVREGCTKGYRIKTTEDLRDMINTGRVG